MTSYMQKKKVHKWVQPDSVYAFMIGKLAACKVHNKTSAFKTSVMWSKVTCKRCLGKK